jgi:two-component SAPR family response regulator
MVRDRKNRDITYLFSAKLKQVFCVILQYSTEDGITSQRLSDILWPDKPASKVKNSRGVTINHLRKALNELDGIDLIYEKGCFRFVLTAEFYCDYTRCIEIISSINGLEENRDELIEILNRGKFLKLTEDSSFDTFKEATEQKLEPVLLLEMEKSFAAESYQATIDLAELVFNIDPLNDTALAFQIKAMQKLKMNEEAKLRYQAFVIEYKKIIGNDYPRHLKV